MRGNISAAAIACLTALIFITPGAIPEETDTGNISPGETHGLLKEPLEGVRGFREDAGGRFDLHSSFPGGHGYMMNQVIPGRASDQENEVDPYDLANGTRIESTGETITGSLEYIDTGGSDWIDWYKISQSQVNPAGGATSGPFNITIRMTSYLDGNMGHDDLFEYRLIETSPGEYDLENDYYDLIRVHVEYYDPWMGLMEMGGTDFLYDDLDDSDSWSHDDNWTFDFRTSVPSTGPEDLNGFEDGLEEVGWYYIRFDLYWLQTLDAPDRASFKVNYEFDIEIDPQEPTDDGSNTIDTAAEYKGSQERSLHTKFDNVDWYRFRGTDSEKLWKLNFSLQRTWGSAGVIPDSEGATTGTIYDSMMHVWVVFPSAGNDSIWGNEDDGWYLGSHVMFAYYITGDNIITGSRYYNFTVTNTGVSNGDRNVYIGTFIEPVTARYEDSSITGFRYNFWYTYARYRIDLLDVTEETVNRQPVLSDLGVRSDNDFSDTGGNLDDEFTFDVTYTDQDGDEPVSLDIFLNPGKPDEESFSMVANHDGGDVKEGRIYSLTLAGDDIGDSTDPISVLVNCTDKIPEMSLRSPLESNQLYLNDTLRVWDDMPLTLSTMIDDMAVLSEDGGRIFFPMDSMNGGPFNDPEMALGGAMVYNTTIEGYSGDQNTELLHVNMTYRDGDGWYAAITPKEDQHGEETLSFYGYDDHSYLIWNTTVTVVSVNDPPVIYGFELNGEEMEIDDSDPMEIEVDLSEELIEEDTRFTFDIDAHDSDPEEDRTPIMYKFLSAGPSDWSGDPAVNKDTGVVTYTPTNDDVRNNGWMMFRISDGSSSIDLRVELDITNTPDTPSLTVDSPVTTLAQGSEWDLRPRVADIDKGDDHVFSINLDQMIDDETEPITDQLSNAVIGEDLITTFDAATGRFTMTPIGDDIWRGDGELLEQITLNIVVRAVDLSGLSDLIRINVTLLKNDPWIPDVSEASVDAEDGYPDQPGIQGLTVTVSAEDYDTTLYGDEWTYLWDFGDGTTLVGKEVTHTYASYGTKVIRMTLTKGDHTTNERTLEVTLVKPVKENDTPPDGGGSITTYILIIAAILVVLIIIALYFLFRRGGEEEPPAGNDRPVSMGYSNERAPTSREDRTGRTERDPDATTCPSCGAIVKKGWFLCPKCKNTLTW